MNNKQLIILYSIGASLFYALQIIIQKIGFNEGLEPVPFIFSRSVVVMIFSFLLFYPLLSSSFSKIKRKPSILLISILAATAIFTFILGQKFTTAINAGFLVNLRLLFIPAFMVIMLKEFPKRHEILAMIIMLIGSFLLITQGKFTMPNVGDILMIGVGLVVALQNVLAKFLMKDISKDIVIFYRVGIGSLILFISIPIFYHSNLFVPLLNSIGYVFGAGLFYFLGVYFFYRAIKLAGPFLPSLFFLFSSIFSSILAYILLKETLTLVQIIGAVGILIGGVLVSMKINES